VNTVLQSNKTINAKPEELSNGSFTTPGDEAGIYRLGDTFEAASP
jgi:hypothetical protein